MNRIFALAAASAAVVCAPLAATAQPAGVNVTASQPVPNPPPSTTEPGPGTADPGYAGQLQGPAFRDVFERITADEQKMAGKKRGLMQLRAIKAEAVQRRARHGGELRDWDRELINKKLDMLEGSGA